MIKIPNESAYFDCDDTLIYWPTHKYPGTMNIKDPCLVKIGKEEEGIMCTPMEKHIAALKQHKAQGNSVIVWSAGGADWAEAVVKALGLEEYVDACMAKPAIYYDDLDCRQFMGSKTYFGI